MTAAAPASETRERAEETMPAAKLAKQCDELRAWMTDARRRWISEPQRSAFDLLLAFDETQDRLDVILDQCAEAEAA